MYTKLLQLGLLSLFVLVARVSAAVPVLQRPDALGVQFGETIQYHVVAIGATAYAATGLPGGVAIDATTGVISGQPDALGTYNVRVTASNADGAASENLSIAVVAPDAAPLIYAPLVVDAFHEPDVGGDRFSSTLKATGSPTSYEVTSPLPAGWEFNAGTLVGSSTEPGLYSVDVSARNEYGIGSSAVLVRVHASCRQYEQTTGTLRPGDTLTVTLRFSRPVSFTGEAPFLEFSTYPSGVTKRIAYASGNGTDTFVFKYTVTTADTTGDILLYRAIQPASGSAVTGLVDALGVTLGSSLPFYGPYTPVSRIEVATPTTVADGKPRKGGGKPPRAR